MPSLPGQGQIQASAVRGRRLGGTAEIRFDSSAATAVGDRRVHQYLERRDSTGGVDLFVSATTPVFVEFDSEVHCDTGYFYAVDSNTDQLVVKRAGRYRITYACSADNTSSSGFSGLRWGIYLNGTTSSELLSRAQSYSYHRLDSRGEDTGTAMTIVDLAADDVLRIGGTKSATGTGNATTVADGSVVMIELLHDDAWTDVSQVAQFDGVIECIEVSKDTSGGSGTTDLDLLIDGSSVVVSAGISVDYTAASVSFPAIAYLNTTTFLRGSKLAVRFVGEETPPATGVVVVLRCRPLVT